MNTRKRTRGGRAAVANYTKAMNTEMLENQKDKIQSPTLQKDNTKKIFEDLNQHGKELLFYFQTTSKKPASDGLIQALEQFRMYAKKRPQAEVIHGITKYMKLPFVTPNPDDLVKHYMDPFGSTNTQKNNQLIEYIYSVVNYDSAEDSLYRGTGWNNFNGMK